MNTPAPGNTNKAKPATPAAPQKDEEKEALRKERDQLKERLERVQDERHLERRTTDPRSDDFDAELALQELWPSQVRESN